MVATGIVHTKQNMCTRRQEVLSQLRLILTMELMKLKRELRG